MNKKFVRLNSKICIVTLLLCFLIGNTQINVLADTTSLELETTKKFDDGLEKLVKIIFDVKKDNPQLSEEQIINTIQEKIQRERSIIDIWNNLTDSEKRLVIRYPLEALKVNKARNIAITQTEIKFGYSGLGDRSDAFRHGIWNAEMAILIGVEKAELFATAHEDKDTQGVESDGYSKEKHKTMDLHNNEAGRTIGMLHIDASEDELADIIYSDIYSENTAFFWLHD